MNPIKNLIGDSQNILGFVKDNKKAMEIIISGIGAAFRGESPIDFMKNLAKKEPALKDYNFDDLGKTAKEVCRDNNVDYDEKKKEIEEFANSYINH